MVVRKAKSRSTLFLTLLTAGVFLVGAVLLPLLVKGQATSLQSIGDSLPPVVMDKAAPSLKLTDLQGDPVSLAETHGKVVLVNNWAAWCPPCQAEMPEMQAFYQANVNRGFLLIAIESGESAHVVNEFVRQYGLTFPIWLDPNGAALEAFHNNNLPSSYVIDQKGNLRLSWTGPVNRQTLEKYINPLIGVANK